MSRPRRHLVRDNRNPPRRDGQVDNPAPLAVTVVSILSKAHKATVVEFIHNLKSAMLADHFQRLPGKKPVPSPRARHYKKAVGKGKGAAKRFLINGIPAMASSGARMRRNRIKPFDSKPFPGEVKMFRT
jgi:hypothetical protein